MRRLLSQEEKRAQVFARLEASRQQRNVVAAARVHGTDGAKVDEFWTSFGEASTGQRKDEDHVSALALIAIAPPSTR